MTEQSTLNVYELNDPVTGLHVKELGMPLLFIGESTRLYAV